MTYWDNSTTLGRSRLASQNRRQIIKVNNRLFRGKPIIYWCYHQGSLCQESLGTPRNPISGNQHPENHNINFHLQEDLKSYNYFAIKAWSSYESKKCNGQQFPAHIGLLIIENLILFVRLRNMSTCVRERKCFSSSNYREGKMPWIVDTTR